MGISTFPEAFPEPRKIFLGFLIARLMEIEDAVYRQMPPTTHSISLMMGIIDSLSEIDKRNLDKQYQRLSHLRGNSDLSLNDLEGIYRELTNYLHKVYLQEINMPIIPAGSLPLVQEPPKQDAVARRVPARLT